MPGLCVRACSQPSATIEHDLSTMLSAMRHHDWHRVEAWHDAAGHAALGRVSLGFVNIATQPVHSKNGNYSAVLAGELFDLKDLCQGLGLPLHDAPTLSHAKILLEGYLRDGKTFLRQLNGTFVAAIWNAETRTLSLISDQFGMKPLYYTQRPGRLTAAAEIKALLVDSDVSRSANRSGMAQFFSFGHLLGDSTLLDAVRALPPASILTYDTRHDQLTMQRYWELPTGFPRAINNVQDEAALLSEIDDAFVQAVRRTSNGTDCLGLALSGGLDARSILAVIDVERTPIQTISMGVPGSLDHRSASRVAAQKGCPHYEYQLDNSVCDCPSYRQSLEKVVHLSDAQYLDQAIVMPMLPTIRSLGIQVLLRGHAGELMHMNKAYNFSLDAEAWQIQDAATLEQWLMRRLCGWMLDNVPEPLLCNTSPQEVQELARTQLRSCLDESAEVTPLIHRLWHLFIRHRLARETAVSLAMINSVVETRVPILDARLIELLLAAPPKLKVGETIQTYIMCKHHPDFLRVLNANTGAPVGAGRLRQRNATLRMKILGKLGVPGYQPYERLGLWLRRELRPLVSDILLSDRCLGRGIFVPETVRNVVRRHWNKEANHTFLLMGMIIHEMGQREFTDGEVPVAVKQGTSASYLEAIASTPGGNR